MYSTTSLIIRLLVFIAWEVARPKGDGSSYANPCDVPAIAQAQEWLRENE